MRATEVITLGRVFALVLAVLLLTPSAAAAECTEASFLAAEPDARLDVGWYETTPPNQRAWWEERGLTLDLAPVAWLALRSYAAPGGTTVLILALTPKDGEANRSATAGVSDELVRVLAQALGVTDVVVQESDAAGPCAHASVSKPYVDPFGLPASIAECRLAAPPYTSLISAVRGTLFPGYATPTAQQLVQRMITTGVQTGCLTA
jgi:hypothetical protein